MYRVFKVCESTLQCEALPNTLTCRNVTGVLELYCSVRFYKSAKWFINQMLLYLLVCCLKVHLWCLSFCPLLLWSELWLHIGDDDRWYNTCWIGTVCVDVLSVLLTPGYALIPVILWWILWSVRTDVAHAGINPWICTKLIVECSLYNHVFVDINTFVVGQCQFHSCSINRPFRFWGFVLKAFVL